MSKSKSFLLDANVVIHLHACGLWGRVVESCEITLARTVVDEAHMIAREDGMGDTIDISNDIDAGRVRVIEVEAAELKKFIQQFAPDYTNRLDPGELETLAHVCRGPRTLQACSGDAIVYRTLALTDRTDQGISLEEILEPLGLARKLPNQFTKAFREREARRGFEDRMGGFGLR